MADAPYLELVDHNHENDHDEDSDSSEMSDSIEEHTNGTANGNSNLQNAKNSLLNAQSAMETVNNHPATKNAKDTLNNGPVAKNVKREAAKTKNEFADLANSRQTPDEPAATGQPLTHYHSMFYRLLSWKNPRATAISFAAVVVFIFAARYLNIIRYIFKAIYMTLGLTATAEIAGKFTLGKGLTSQVRPRKYFTIPKASLERLLDDVEQLINFFVIESQRIVFAENVFVTVSAFFASLVSYFLIKFVPLWGLTLIAASIHTWALSSTSRTKRSLMLSLSRLVTLSTSKLLRSAIWRHSILKMLLILSSRTPTNTPPKHKRPSTSTVVGLPLQRLLGRRMISLLHRSTNPQQPPRRLLWSLLRRRHEGYKVADFLSTKLYGHRYFQCVHQPDSTLHATMSLKDCYLALVAA